MKYLGGGKFKVGSTITRIGSFNDCNLLKGIYTVSNAKLNGSPLPSTPHVVEKSMVFTCTATWAFDNNEPKCILSPRLLRIPNSSYKILGHIPDISGHGNHGKINNSAYEGMSGVNGYPVLFGIGKTWGQMPTYGSIYTVDSNKCHITKILHANWGLIFSYVKRNDQLCDITEIPSFKIRVSGLKGDSKLRYSYIKTENAVYQTLLDLDNGIHKLPKSLRPTDSMVNDSWIGFTISPIAENETTFDCDITIEVLPDYEGAYCLDGVNDFVTIPTLSSGGKQVLMKANWQSNTGDTILYDQRFNIYNYEFAIYNSNTDNYSENSHAYSSRNNGKTYIDGILNTYIKSAELQNVTHNIIATNELSSGSIPLSPIIGSNINHDSTFAQMSLYDFMLFDEISTDDKILELNEYVGIEGNTE